jgi:hypothetical protein
MPAYTIKALEWKPTGEDKFEVQTILGRLSVAHIGRWRLYLKNIRIDDFEADSADAAKLAAEPWYRERLASALTPSPLEPAAREAREILEQVVDYFSSDCRFDHHDQCQAHALQSRGDCFVALAKDLLESQALEGARTCK